MGNWQKSNGGLKQIDADDSEVWGVNGVDVVYKPAMAVDGRIGSSVSGGLNKCLPLEIATFGG